MATPGLMATQALAERARQPGAWQRLSWAHPELWVVALAAGAWVLLIREHHGWPLVAASAHEHHHIAVTGGSSSAVSSTLTELRWWCLMVLAMMLPLVLKPARITAQRSLWPRRQRAILAFVAAYLAMWLLLGAMLLAALETLRFHDLPQPALGMAGLVLAGVWQLMPARRRFAVLCHRTMPLAPRGLRADRDCLRYGYTIGTGCVLSCGAMMFACVALDHSLAAMAVLALLGLYERYRPRPNELLLSGLPLLMAVGLAFTPLLQLRPA